MIPLLFLLFIVVPIAEIYVIIQVGQAIGALWTILLLIADSIIGARLVSWQGRRADRRRRRVSLDTGLHNRRLRPRAALTAHEGCAPASVDADHRAPASAV